MPFVLIQWPQYFLSHGPAQHDSEFPGFSMSEILHIVDGVVNSMSRRGHNFHYQVTVVAK